MKAGRRRGQDGMVEYTRPERWGLRNEMGFGFLGRGERCSGGMFPLRRVVRMHGFYHAQDFGRLAVG